MAILYQRCGHIVGRLVGHEDLWVAGAEEARAPDCCGCQGTGGRLRPGNGGAIATSITVGSRASETPCGRLAGAQTTVPLPTSRVSSPTTILAFPDTTR